MLVDLCAYLFAGGKLVLALVEKFGLPFSFAVFSAGAKAYRDGRTGNPVEGEKHWRRMQKLKGGPVGHAAFAMDVLGLRPEEAMKLFGGGGGVVNVKPGEVK